MVDVQNPATGAAQTINAITAVGRAASVVQDLEATVSAGAVALPSVGATPQSLAAAVAAAIPANLAQLVVDELSARLTHQ